MEPHRHSRVVIGVCGAVTMTKLTELHLYMYKAGECHSVTMYSIIV